MRQFIRRFNQDYPETPTNHDTVRVPFIGDPKPATWYYGVKCACRRLLLVCEDCFGGKGREERLEMPRTIEVKCDCGAVTNTQVLQKFWMD